MFEKHIYRLQYLDKLKTEAETYSRMATFYGLATATLLNGESAYEYELKKHDDLAELFNATKYWWMPKIKLKKN